MVSKSDILIFIEWVTFWKTSLMLYLLFKTCPLPSYTAYNIWNWNLELRSLSRHTGPLNSHSECVWQSNFSTCSTNRSSVQENLQWSWCFGCITTDGNGFSCFYFNKLSAERLNLVTSSVKFRRSINIYKVPEVKTLFSLRNA